MQAFGKLWHFLWKEDSLASWLVNIALAFLLIRYIFYPLLGIILGTSFPIVAVVSESMEHELGQGSICGRQFAQRPASFNSYWQACGNWYEQQNITAQQFRSFPFPHGFNKGDIVLLWRAHPGNLRVGDLLVFQGDKPQPIIHRVVRRWQEQSQWYYQTKGDHNSESIGGNLEETKIATNRIYGKGILRIPYLGWVKIIFVEVLKPFGIIIQR